MKDKLIVYLADDHTVVRKGMIRLLRTFSRVTEVGEAGEGRELLALIEQREPDAVILDVEMPGMGGIEAAHAVSDKFPDVKILILTMHTEETLINRLMDLGVHGFLSKTSGPDEVEKALYAVVDHDFYKNEIVKKALVQVSRIHTPAFSSRLSDREREVLMLICQEYSPAEISEQLQISEKTFFNHRANILAKTHARTNVGLVKFAHQYGLINIA